MRIGHMIDYAGAPQEAATLVSTMEKAGLDIVWVAEAYGFDAVSVMGYLAATTETVTIASGILNIYSRTPGTIAQTAAGLDAVSGGRFELGLGASGPQVIEGWHGMPYDLPLTRTREMIDLVRRMVAREVIEHDGEVFTLPLPKDQGKGLGKPLKMLTRPVRDRIPVHVASIGPGNVEMTAEVADGWLPIFFHPDRAHEVWGDSLEAGLAKRDESLGELDITCSVAFGVAEGERRSAIVDGLRDHYALYIGGMGAKDKNFYNDLAVRYGFEEEAATVQELYLDGRKDEAAAAVPERFILDTNLVGPASWIAERLESFRDAGVTTLTIRPTGDPAGDVETLRGML